MLLNARHLQEVSGDTDQPSKGTSSNSGAAGRTGFDGRGIDGGGRSAVAATNGGGGGRLGGIGVGRGSHGGQDMSGSTTIRIVSYLRIECRLGSWLAFNLPTAGAER